MRTFLLLPLVFISGCSWIFGDTFHNRALDYRQAEEAAATRLPDGINLSTYDRYPIPDEGKDGDLGEEFRVPVPVALELAEAADEQATTLSEYRSFALNPRLDRDGAGTEILSLDSSFAVSWARVADALTASSLKVSDLNRSLSVYYLDLPNPEAENDERSWWGKLWGKRIEPEVTYELRMVRSGNGVYLTLLQDADTLADAGLTRTVLKEIYDQLVK